MDVRAEQRKEIERRKKAGIKSPLSETRQAQALAALANNERRVAAKKKKKSGSDPVSLVRDWMKSQNDEFTRVFNEKAD